MRIAAFAGAIALVLAAPAFADPGGFINDRAYFEGTVGYTLGTDVEVAGTDLPMEGGYFFGGAIGYALPQGVSVEGEVTYNSRDFETVSASVDALAVMANVLMDFTVEGRTGGYIGGGIGAVSVEVGTGGGSINEWAFGYQAMAGLTRQASENAVVFLEYRYQGANEVKNASTRANYDSHTIGVGVRFGM